jgi:hypothetical protein
MNLEMIKKWFFEINCRYYRIVEMAPIAVKVSSVEILKGQNERKGNERLIWSGLNFGFH